MAAEHPSSRLQFLAAVLILVGSIISSCRPQPLGEATSSGVTVRLMRACTDGATTTLYLQTALDIDIWGLRPDDFSGPNSAYFLTSITLLQDGRSFSSTSSSRRSQPEVDSTNAVAIVSQEFVYPGSPDQGSEMSLNARVTIHNAPGIRQAADDLHMPVPVAECP